MRERRKDKRYEIEGAVVAVSRWTAMGWLRSKLTGKRHGEWLRVKDICCGGVSFTTSEPPKPHNAILLMIRLPGVKRPHSVRGVVEWVKKQSGGESRVLRQREYSTFVVGVSFKGRPRALAQAIERHRVLQGA